jgi:GAF domain-containing protein
MVTPPDETTADPYAVIAALRAERDAALARESALAEVLDVINRSPGDPGPVFEAILERAHRLCGADAGALMRYDGECFHAVATHGLPDEFAALVHRPFRGASHQRLIDGERIVHVADAKAIPSWRELGEVERAFFDHTNLRASLFVPLRKDGALLGFISADRNEARPFSDNEIALLEGFAAQAVIAIENARLLTEQREALDRQTATAEVLQVINASPGNLAPVFDTMLDKAMLLCGASFGLLYTNDGSELRLVAQRGVPEVFAKYRAEHPLQPHSYGGIKQLYATKATVHVLDLAVEYSDGPPIPIVELGLARTLLMVPLLKDAAAIGHIALYRQEVRAFSEKQTSLLESFADQAVIPWKTLGCSTSSARP